jgi:hypothetical protein
MEMHYGITGGDLDADGDNDLVLPADYGSPGNLDSVRVFLNNGDGTFASPVGYEAGLFPRDPTVIDLDNDGDLDLVAASQMTLNIVILLNNGDATFETHTSGWLASNTRYLDAADLDNDGDADIAAVGWDDDVIAYYYNNGDGTFAEPVINSLSSDPGEVVLADFDLDGDHDVAYMLPTQLIVLQNQTVSCCGRYTGGYTGNTDCSTDGKRTLNDITVLIDNVFILHGELCCPENSNVDGSTDGKTTLNDITRLIDNVFISHSESAPCP